MLKRWAYLGGCLALAVSLWGCDDGEDVKQTDLVSDTAVDTAVNDTALLDTVDDSTDTQDVTETLDTIETPDVADEELDQTNDACTASGYTALEEKAQATWGTIVQYSGKSDTIPPIDSLSIQLYYGMSITPLSAPGTVVLGADVADQNYETCATCVLIYTSTALFFATSGTLDITTFGSTDGSMFEGTLTDVVLQEVTISDKYVSTPVPDGSTWCLDRYDFKATIN